MIVVETAFVRVKRQAGRLWLVDAAERQRRQVAMMRVRDGEL
jgi:hypothetical protein